MWSAAVSFGGHNESDCVNEAHVLPQSEFFFRDSIQGQNVFPPPLWSLSWENESFLASLWLPVSESNRLGRHGAFLFTSVCKGRDVEGWCRIILNTLEIHGKSCYCVSPLHTWSRWNVVMRRHFSNLPNGSEVLRKNDLSVSFWFNMMLLVILPRVEWTWCIWYISSYLKLISWTVMSSIDGLVLFFMRTLTMNYRQSVGLKIYFQSPKIGAQLNKYCVGNFKGKQHHPRWLLMNWSICFYDQ